MPSCHSPRSLQWRIHKVGSVPPEGLDWLGARGLDLAGLGGGRDLAGWEHMHQLHNPLTQLGIRRHPRDVRQDPGHPLNPLGSQLAIV